jgi:hypothetical protein
LRLDDQNIEVRPAAQKARGRGYSSGPAAGDYDVMNFTARLLGYAGHGSLPFAWFMISLNRRRGRAAYARANEGAGGKFY